MLKRKRIDKPHVGISICREVLESMFDECDRFHVDETGGRLIGFYELHKAALNIEVCGYIGPGPNARRSPASFFQDGEYQETIFRKIEAQNPDIEHLGNWHSHHVNGLSTLSSGDIATYRRIVNHEKHNTDFFYALLVVAKNQNPRVGDRYLVKHFLFRRDESEVLEVGPAHVRIIDRTPVFIDRGTERDSDEIAVVTRVVQTQPAVQETRSKDNDAMSDLYPSMKPFLSKKTTNLYWKGRLVLVDDTSVELLVLESLAENTLSYSVTTTGPDAKRFHCREEYLNRTFISVRKAVFSFERDLNREVFAKLKSGRHSN